MHVSWGTRLGGSGYPPKVMTSFMNSPLHRQTDSKFCQLPKIDRQTDSNLESCIRENVFPFQKSLPSQLACLWCSSVTGDRSYRCELCLRARKVSVFGVHDVWSSRTDAQILLCVARAGYTSGFFSGQIFNQIIESSNAYWQITCIAGYTSIFVSRSNIQSNYWIKAYWQTTSIAIECTR